MLRSGSLRVVLGPAATVSWSLGWGKGLLLVAENFSVNPVQLDHLLQQAARGDLQLPDFQRGWVWDDKAIVSLLASISLSFPIGAVMILATGNPDVRFAPRLLEGVTLGSSKEPSLLLLDGQQRLTSLFFALRSPDAVVTRDSRGKKVKRHYYADIARCLDHDPYDSREEYGIVGVPENRLVTENFGRTIKLDLRSRSGEIASEMFPLDIVFDPDRTTDWQMEYLQSGPGEIADRLEKWKGFAKRFISQFLQYQVPTIKLSKGTSKEAVCQVFEKVNTGGVSLTVFELLTATYAADEFNLREDWDKRKAEFSNHPALERFDAPQFLQAVTLLATHDRRMRNVEDAVPPAVGCKRRDVLRLELEDYEKWANSASRGLIRAVEFLHSEYIFDARDVPYATQLVPLGAIFAVLSSEGDNHAAVQKIRRWFWCGVFGEMYGGSTETRFAFDLPECVAWVRGEGPEPRTVREAQFQAERLLSLRTRNSAAYKGLYAMQMKAGCQDFRTGVTLGAHTYFDHSVDIHHIFPKRWCASDGGVQQAIADSVVNKTPIDSYTNRLIGGAAPSRYLSRLEDKYGIDRDELDSILLSHDIDPAALRRDDFPDFFNHRFEKMLRLIQRAMGKPVNRNPDRDESPFASTAVMDEKVRDVIAGGESDTVEFKSTGRNNLYTGTKDPVIEWAIVKSVAAFMNSQGGELLIGVDDTGQPVGIEEDYPFVHSRNRDGWELWLGTLIRTTLGKVEAADVTPRYCVLDGKTVAYIKLARSSEPVFTTPTKAAAPKGNILPGENKFFYIRMANATEQLAGNDLLTYTNKHWPTG